MVQNYIFKKILKNQAVKKLLDDLEIDVDKVNVCTLSNFSKITEESNYRSSIGNYDIEKRLFAVRKDGKIEEAETEYEYYGSSSSYEPEKEIENEGATKQFIFENLNNTSFFVFTEKVNADYNCGEEVGNFLTIVLPNREDSVKFLETLKNEIVEEIDDLIKNLKVNK